MTNRVNFNLIPFPPIQWSGDIFQLAQLLADHLQGNLDQSAFTGQMNGTEPTTDIGLWLDHDVWKRWDADNAKYGSLAVEAGLFNNGILHTARINATNTSGDIEFDLPDTAGTLARIEDVISPIQTITQASNTITVNWNQPNKYAVISNNVAIVDGGDGKDGATAELWIETPPGHGVALTITFPAVWRKSSISLGTTDATHRVVDYFIIRRVGTDTFVYKAGSFPINQAGGGDPNNGGGDTAPPVYQSSTARSNSSLIKVTFNELLQGGGSPVTAWRVTKSGNTQTIDDVSILGSIAFVTLTNPIGPGVPVAIRYITDGSVKDLAGNQAISFGPSTVSVTS